MDQFSLVELLKDQPVFLEEDQYSKEETSTSKKGVREVS